MKGGGNFPPFFLSKFKVYLVCYAIDMQKIGVSTTTFNGFKKMIRPYTYCCGFHNLAKNYMSP